MKKKGLPLVIILFFVLNFAVILLPSDASAETAMQRFYAGLNKSGAAMGYDIAAATAKTLPEKIGSVIKFILAFVGVIFLILMIYGGFTWMLARGNEQEVEKAKNILKNSTIGLIVVLSAYAITAFVASELGKSLL